jgi:predicted alpha/beta-hydrolase family hydrolase
MTRPAGQRLSVDVRGAKITAMRTPPAGAPAWTFIYAPGAGSNLHDPFGNHLSELLPALGVAVVRFQFP